MIENSEMVFNSIAVKRRSKYKKIELFAIEANLEHNLEREWKQATFRVSKEKYQSLWDENPCLSGFSELFFTTWEDELKNIPKKEKVSVNVDLDYLFSIGRCEMTQKIVRYFRNMGFPVCRDFIGRIEVWIPKINEKNSTLYNRYTLKPYYRDITDGWQIDISHSAESRCSTNTLLNFDLGDFSFKVIAGTEVLHKNDIKQYHYHEYEGGYPIVNKQIGSILNLEEPYSYDRDKYVTKMKKISDFIHTYLITPDFQNALDIDILNDGKLISVNPMNIFMVDNNAKRLKYGNNANGSSPRLEFPKNGPFIRPKIYKYFFVCLNSSKSCNARNRLYNIFQNGIDSSVIHDKDIELGSNKTFTRLSKYLDCPLSWESNLSLCYKSYDTALDELKTHLMNNSRFKPDVNYIAIIVSEIHKDSPNTKLHELYYKMKELLMKSKITSQVIYAQNIDNTNFKFFIPNMAAAIIGKQDGMPWGLDSLSNKNDMIVGIGAYRQQGQKPYLGTAFCFDKEGKFREFDCCRADDTDALGTSLKKALWQFYTKYDKPDRLIIHYYKKLRKDEGDRIERMLKQTGLQCPTYVVNMVTAVNDDLIAFNTKEENYMPISGTYVHLRDNQFLLYNNEKYTTNSRCDILFPIKLTITGVNAEGNPSQDDITDIITQVYQFCRLYWKSVKMQNIPITIAYPELVAKYVPHFTDENLPEFGKHNLWML